MRNPGRSAARAMRRRARSEAEERAPMRSGREISARGSVPGDDGILADGSEPVIQADAEDVVGDIRLCGDHSDRCHEQLVESPEIDVEILDLPSQLEAQAAPSMPAPRVHPALVFE